MTLHPGAHFLDDVDQEPVEQFLQVRKGRVVGAQQNIGAEGEQNYYALAGDAIEEELVEEGTKVLVLHLIERNLKQKQHYQLCFRTLFAPAYALRPLVDEGAMRALLKLLGDATQIIAQMLVDGLGARDSPKTNIESG